MFLYPDRKVEMVTNTIPDIPHKSPSGPISFPIALSHSLDDLRSSPSPSKVSITRNYPELGSTVKIQGYFWPFSFHGYNPAS